jgi:hypothetical protein
VKGRIRGRLPELPPREFLDRLIKLYNFQWYYDGRVLYVSDAHKAQSRLLILNPISFDAFRDGKAVAYRNDATGFEQQLSELGGSGILHRSLRFFLMRTFELL